MPLVVDASLVFRLLLPTPAQADLRGRVDAWLQDGGVLVAPTLWRYEMVSALVKAVYFATLTDEEARRALGLVDAFPVELIVPDARLSEAAYGWGRRLQRANAYDAFYLALAEALGCELWTADRRLARAAQQPWVQLLGGGE
jgi:predicted nucleic acid-binding protein